MTVDCHKCIHYHVTWDNNFPHGCRAMRFKSRQLPITEVRKVMQSKDCLLFYQKVKEKNKKAESIKTIKTQRFFPSKKG